MRIRTNKDRNIFESRLLPTKRSRATLNDYNHIYVYRERPLLGETEEAFQRSQVPQLSKANNVGRFPPPAGVCSRLAPCDLTASDNTTASVSNHATQHVILTTMIKARIIPSLPNVP